MITNEDLGATLALARAAAELLIESDPTVAAEWREAQGWIDTAAGSLELSLRTEAIPESFRPLSEAIHYLGAMLAFAVDQAARADAVPAVTRALEQAQRAAEYAVERGRLRRASIERGVHRATEPVIPAGSAREDRACSDARDRWSALRPQLLREAARRVCRCKFGTCEQCLRRAAGGVR